MSHEYQQHLRSSLKCLSIIRITRKAFRSLIFIYQISTCKYIMTYTTSGQQQLVPCGLYRKQQEQTALSTKKCISCKFLLFENSPTTVLNKRQRTPKNNQKWTIERNWQHSVHKMKKNITKTQHNMCWTSLHIFQHKKCKIRYIEYLTIEYWVI